jgi:hypothetical protein
MQISRLTNAAALGVTLATLLGTAAKADSIYVSSPVVIEQQLVTPRTTVVEERTISIPQPASTIVEQRSVIVPSTPVVIPSTQTFVVGQPVLVQSEPETIMKRTMTIGTRKPANSTKSVDISLQSGPAPTFGRRIELMKEQVDLGLSKGLMQSSAADSFKTRLNSLTYEANTVSAVGTPKTLSDSLEQKLTGLNIEISDAMNVEKQLDSQSQIQ